MHLRVAQVFAWGTRLSLLKRNSGSIGDTSLRPAEILSGEDAANPISFPLLTPLAALPTLVSSGRTCWMKLGRMLPWPPLQSHGLQAAEQRDVPGNWRASLKTS